MRYAILIVGARGGEPRPGLGPTKIEYRRKARARFYYTERAALSAIAHCSERDERWRIIEIPAGETLDYDGAVVAELERGRLF